MSEGWKSQVEISHRSWRHDREEIRVSTSRIDTLLPWSVEGPVRSPSPAPFPSLRSCCWFGPIQVKGRHELQHFALFGVFDGHNGRLSAEALAEGLHTALARHPQFRQNPEEVGGSHWCFRKAVYLR